VGPLIGVKEFSTGLPLVLSVWDTLNALSAQISEGVIWRRLEERVDARNRYVILPINNFTVVQMVRVTYDKGCSARLFA
jgi:hypothetical protein